MQSKIRKYLYKGIFLLFISFPGLLYAEHLDLVAFCESIATGGVDTNPDMLFIVQLAEETTANLEAKVTELLAECNGDAICEQGVIDEGLVLYNAIWDPVQDTYDGLWLIFYNNCIIDNLEEPEPPCDPDVEEGPNACGSPIVIDLNGDGFSFTGLTDFVFFDLDGDGQADITAWTQAHGDDAFLVMDRNGNDVVDGGGELFGTGTMLLSGNPAQHGYEALAELDLEEWGGNGDGEISVKDHYYSELMLWNDINHNGISEADEIMRLKKASISVLSLDVTTSSEVDEHGNALAYRSEAYRKLNDDHKKQVVYQTIDVFLKSVLIGH